MESMTKTVAPALRALLEGLIDYAGLFPPAKVGLADALENYSRYKTIDQSWMLRWFVVTAAQLDKVPESFDGSLSILSGNAQSRAAVIESKAILSASCPVYCEVSSLEPAALASELDTIKSAGNFAKIRAGGVTPDAIPTVSQVAGFISECARRKLTFKATAGLHHPVRSEQALTYDRDAQRAIMHGFLNFLMAAAFAWHGKGHVEEVLSETDPTSFKFDDRAYWKDHSLTEDEVRQARKDFMHAIGSCSFEEPIEDLKALRLL